MTTTGQTATCASGASTDTPCLRPAVYHDGEEGPRFCERHLKVVRYREFIGEIETFLDYRLAEIKEWADSQD